MVSFWPWRGADSSPASFEKALSALSTKIANTQAQLDKARSTSRRLRVIWTLYFSFAYLVFAIVEFLVVGGPRMGPLEWTGVAAGPVLIYAVRRGLGAFFGYRTESLEARLRDQQGERAKTIQKLKEATKYDSTLELLQKYGDGEGKAGRKGKKGGDDEDGGQGQQKGRHGRQSLGGPGTPNRTGIAPPPTANIQRGDVRFLGSAPGTPQPGGDTPFGTPLPRQGGRPGSSGLQPSEEFAPNAFDGGAPPLPPQQQMLQQPPVPALPSETHWYDRILDTLLGEDETAPKNRIVLICGRCRLVNGQAPPGTRSLSELGLWKCMACGAMNGEMDEGKKIVKEVLAREAAHKAEASPSAARNDGAADEDDSNEDSSDLVEVEKEEAPEAPVEAVDVTTKEEVEEKGVRKRKGKGKK